VIKTYVFSTNCIFSPRQSLRGSMDCTALCSSAAFCCVKDGPYTALHPEIPHVCSGFNRNTTDVQCLFTKIYLQCKSDRRLSVTIALLQCVTRTVGLRVGRRFVYTTFVFSIGVDYWSGSFTHDGSCCRVHNMCLAFTSIILSCILQVKKYYLFIETIRVRTLSWLIKTHFLFWT